MAGKKHENGKERAGGRPFPTRAAFAASVALATIGAAAAFAISAEELGWAALFGKGAAWAAWKLAASSRPFRFALAALGAGAAGIVLTTTRDDEGDG